MQCYQYGPIQTRNLYNRILKAVPLYRFLEGQALSPWARAALAHGCGRLAQQQGRVQVSSEDSCHNYSKSGIHINMPIALPVVHAIAYGIVGMLDVKFKG